MMQFIKKKEFYFFLLIILGHTIPALIFTFFPSLDGPAHLYNSTIIVDLLSNNEGVLSEFIVFNSELVPNWIGHFILALFNTIGGPIFAEKGFLLLYLFGFPLSFRFMLKQLSPNYKVYSYTIFPFLFSNLFCLGFYNFSFAFIFLFLIIGFTVKSLQKRINLKSFLSLFCLLFLMYISHIVVYGIGLFIISSIALLNYEHGWKRRIKNCFGILASASFTLVLSILYFSSRTSSDSSKRFIESSELFSNLLDNTSLIAYNHEIESTYTQFITWSILALVILPILYTYIKPNSISFSEFLKRKLIWIALPFIMLGALFILPNESGGAGYVSIRFQYLFFLFLLPLGASLRLSSFLRISLIAIMLISSFGLQLYYTKVSRDLNQMAKSIESMADKVKSTDIILPLNFKATWINNHFSNYLGIKETPLILSNYELSTNYFPLHWKENENFRKFRGTLNSFHESEEKVEELMNYSKTIFNTVLIIGEIPEDKKYESLRSTLKNNFDLQNSNELCSVYKKKLP